MKVPLNVGVKPEDGEIVEVGECRHRVIWAGDDKPSTVTYCNHCGSAFCLENQLTKELRCACGAPADD